MNSTIGTQSILHASPAKGPSTEIEIIIHYYSPVKARSPEIPMFE